MSVIESIKGMLGDDTESSVTRTEYYCPACDHEFESAKNDQTRVSCPECLESDVTTVSGG